MIQDSSFDDVVVSWRISFVAFIVGFIFGLFLMGFFL